jgi:hypothetical protein
MRLGEIGELDIGDHLVAAERDRRQVGLDGGGRRLGRVDVGATGKEDQEGCEEGGRTERHAAINARRLIPSHCGD